jgi:hypothetical protein
MVKIIDILQKILLDLLRLEEYVCLQNYIGAPIHRIDVLCDSLLNI